MFTGINKKIWRNSVVIGTYPSILKKTIIVILNKHTCSSQFLAYDSPLEQVKEYKDLGIMLLNKPLFRETPIVLAKQTNKSLILFLDEENY